MAYYDNENENETKDIDDISPFLFSKKQYLDKELKIIHDMFFNDNDLD